MGRKPKKIVPLVKTDPDRIAENANLGVYEKMAEKIANSSDDIIDAALAKLDGEQYKSTGPKAPVTYDDAVKPMPPTPAVEDPVALDETEIPSGETISKGESAAHDEHPIQHDEAVDDLTRKIDNLKIENQEMRFRLLQQVPLQIQGLQNEINGLTRKNDDLILRNSELEFENSRLHVENTTLKARLENLEAQKITQGRKPIPEGYTRLGPQRPGWLISGANLPPPPKTTMNGYESWN